MIVHIDHRSAIPPFEQLRTQLRDLIVSGSLESGHRLPTVRQMAGDLGVANGTVARAYHELESGGLIVTAGRRGTIVAQIDANADEARRRALDAAARRFGDAVANLGASPEELRASLIRTGVALG